jgi:hypothetical protein
MQEVFSKSTDPNVPLQAQEYYELRLDDLGFPFRPHFIDKVGTIARHRFMVFQTHAAWSEIDRSIIWDDYQHEECATLEEAQRRYERRRAALAGKGFVYSDMDF